MLSRSMSLLGSLSAVLLVASASLLAQQPEPTKKLDPMALEVMDRFEREGRYVHVLKDGRTEVFGTVRVVVELERRPKDPTWSTLSVGDKVPVMARAIELRQDEFLADVRRGLTPAVLDAVRFTRRLTLQYAICAEVTSRVALEALAALPGVAMVWNDNLNEKHTIEGRALTGSDAADSNGFDGAGVGIAILDTHFDLLHGELGGSTTLPNSVVKGGEDVTNPGSGAGNGIHDRSTLFDCEHGTAAASIARRYATGADIYGLVVFPMGVGTASDSDIAAAINWCVTNKNGVGGGAPIRVISMSLGGGMHASPIGSGTLHNACGTALANDIVCLASAGNDGWNNAIESPAASTNCMSVGSTWDANAGSYSSSTCTDPSRQVDERACYSATASFRSVYAPAESVVAARCGGGTLFFGGTSAACPAAAGLTAQLLHARPQYIGDKSGLVSLFQTTGVQVIGDTAKRRINLTAAIGVLGGIEACFENQIGANLDLGDDELSVNNALGFTFPYPGGSTTAVDICSNGFFYLQTGSSTDARWDDIRGSTFNADPGSIAPIWKDLDPSSSGAVYFNTFADRAVITWLEVQPFGSPSVVFTVQCQIYDTGECTFLYDADVALVADTLIGITPGSTPNPGSIDLSSLIPHDSLTEPSVFQRFTGGSGFDFDDFVLRFRLNGSGGYLVDDGCPIASWETYGVGCPPATPLTVDAASGSLPVLGQQFFMVPSNVIGGAAIAALHLGLTESSIELSIIGMPDCYLLSSVEASIPLFLVEGLPFPYTVGSDPGLLGTTFRVQPIALSAGTNPLGVVTANAGRMTFGY